MATWSQYSVAWERGGAVGSHRDHGYSVDSQTIRRRCSSFVAREVKGPRVLTASGRIVRRAAYCALTLIDV